MNTVAALAVCFVAAVILGHSTRTNTEAIAIGVVFGLLAATTIPRPHRAEVISDPPDVTDGDLETLLAEVQL